MSSQLYNAQSKVSTASRCSQTRARAASEPRAQLALNSPAPCQVPLRRTGAAAVTPCQDDDAIFATLRATMDGLANIRQFYQRDQAASHALPGEESSPP